MTQISIYSCHASLLSLPSTLQLQPQLLGQIQREMQTSIFMTTPSSSHSIFKPIRNPLLGYCLSSKPCLPLRRRASSFTIRALLSATKKFVLKDFHERRALKVFFNTPNPILCWHEFHLLCFDWLLMLRKRGRNRSFLVFAFRFLFILGLRQACIVSVQICLFVFVAAKCLL